MQTQARRPPTVGRTRELAQLDAALDMLRARAGGARPAIVVEGEPGVGKTHVLAELHARAERRGHLVLHGSAAEFERDLPFAVWVDALDPYVATQDLSGDPRWDAALVSELAEIFPSVPRTDAARHPAVADERYLAHRAVRTLLELLSREKPLVLILDDLHWADSASVELIVALTRRGGPATALLAFGCRSGKLPAPLMPAFASGAVTIVELAPLSELEAAQLAGDELTAAQRAVIFAESGGNPFYTLQLARTTDLPAHSRSGDRVAVGAGVPRVVAAGLIEEVLGLPADCRTLLEAGSVAGDPFEPELAYAIGELSPEAGVAALDALLAAGLLRTTSVPRRMAFRHPLVRRAIYETTGGGWRLAAHGRAAAALAAAGTPAAALAHHVEQSAPPGDETAIALLLEAATATAARSPTGAARWFAAALRLMAFDDVGRRLQALLGLAGVLRVTGDLTGCRQALLDAIDLLPADLTAHRLPLTAGCAIVENLMGHHADARKRLVVALEELPDQDSREAVVARLALSEGDFFTMRVQSMRALAVEALAGAQALGEPSLIAAATAVAAHTAAVAGDVATATAGQDAAAAIVDAMSDDDLAADLSVANRLGHGDFYLGRFGDCIAHMKRGIAVSRASGQGQYISLMTQFQALGTMMRGDLVAARELQTDALESARLTANDYLTAAALLTSSQIAMAGGDTGAALQAAQESVALVEGIEPGLIPSFARAGLAVAMLEAGHRAAAADAVVAPVGGWPLPLLPAIFRVVYLEAKTRADLGRGDIAAAEAAAALAETAADTHDLRIVRAIAMRARAAVRLAAGEVAAAAELALAAAAEADAADAPIEATRARLLAGRACAADGDRARAVALLRAAEAQLDACGALGARAEARRELRRLGARVELRGPATPADAGIDALTAREREIAELITDRKTNREIAGALFLSPKTVESHVRNLFVKLGVSSRVDIARQIEQSRRAPVD